MAFGQDLLAGLAGAAQGASQGYGQVQDQRMQQARLKMQQMQQQQEMEDRKRQQVFQARQLLEGGMQVDKDTLSQFAQYPELLAGITKDPTTGMGMVQKTPQQQEIELRIQEHQQAAQLRQDAMAAQDEWDNLGDEAYNQPVEWRMNIANRIKRINKDFDFMTPAQKLQDNVKLEQTRISGQMQIAAAQARGYATTAAAGIRANAQETVSVKDALGLLMQKKNAWGQPVYDPNDPATIQAAQQLAQQLNQQGQQHLAQPQGQPGGQPKWSNLRRVQ
jgi:hypothetical protein